MRILVGIQTRRLPIANSMMLVSFVKQIIRNQDERLYEKYYKLDSNGRNKIMKPFTCSLYTNQKVLSGNDCLTDKAHITISTADYNLFVTMLEGLKKINEFEYKDYSFRVVMAKAVTEKPIEKDVIIFKTLSPIVMRMDEEDLDISDDRYTQSLNYITEKTFETFNGTRLKRKIEIIPIDMKEKLVTQEITGTLYENGQRFKMTKGYSGTFALKGDKFDLKLIRELGLGFRRSQGFGCLEVVE